MIISESTVNIIRGKNLVGKASQLDTFKLCQHIASLETLLNEADKYDCFGTEGWRRYAGKESRL